MSTAYIIGAGASHAVWGFPLLQGFLGDCEAQLRAWYEGNQESRLEWHVQRRFGSLKHANLEDILADLDNMLSGLGKAWFGSGEHPDRLMAFLVRGELLQVIQRRLDLTDCSTVPDEAASSYEKVFSHMQPPDRVLTFNYDCGIETYATVVPKKHPLTVASKGQDAGALLTDPGYKPIDDDKTIGSRTPTVLKLHGSLNYFACSNAMCPKTSSVFVAEYHPYAYDSDSFCPTCGSTLEPVIIPPSMTKSFDRFPRLALLWRLGREFLSKCDKVVVWGFSCPPSDYHVAWLLRDTCRVRTTSAGKRRERPLQEVHVIDPCHEKVTGNMKSIIGPSGVWKGFPSHEDYSP